MSESPDVRIAQQHQLEPITTIAQRAGIPDAALIPYGGDKAKIDVAQLGDDTGTKGKVVLVTAMSPTPAGEGKSTVLIGLADALRSAGRRSIVTIREPSQGPVMGIKGGAAGGGWSQIVPMESINLHFTGDMHAITAATNTLAALIDNHVHHGNSCGLDPRRITWRRCVDVNDRSLRHIVTGLGGPAHGQPQETGFDITAASEMMAILCLAENAADLQRRLGRILVGYTRDSRPITVDDLGVAGALAALLQDALLPNLVQTLGGTPALVHGGPFANIAHGCNSLIATRTAQRLADVVLTEAGFGADLGAEKFFDIKARAGQLRADAAVLVVTIRSLKFNGGAAKPDLLAENVSALRAGLCNAERHVQILRRCGVEPVVAVNVFTSDTAAELAEVAQWAERFGVRVAETRGWELGGAGAAELANLVLQEIDATGSSGAVARSQQLYELEDGVEHAIRTIAMSVYGAADVEFSAEARRDLQVLRDNGWDTLPVCISKTQYSFSDDPEVLGAPEGHTLHVRALVPKLGAGFVVVLTGQVLTMPGLPRRPAANGISVGADGKIAGLF